MGNSCQHKGVSLISGVLFIAISLAAIALIYQGVQPGIRNIEQSAAINYMTGLFSELDNAARKVASEGEGSRRVVNARIPDGMLAVNATSDKITWKLETSANAISPRATAHAGNAMLGSQLSSSAFTANYSRGMNVEALVMENEHLRVFLRKLGSAGGSVSIATSSIMLAIFQKDTNAWLDAPGLAVFTVDDQETSSYGSGYTYLEKEGDDLPEARAVAFVNSSYMPYTIIFTLPSGADFVEIEGKT